MLTMKVSDPSRDKVITIALSLSRNRSHVSRHCYRLAGRSVVADTRLAGLDTFRLQRPADHHVASLDLDVLKPTKRHSVNVRGWTAGEFRDVSCGVTDTGYVVSIEGIGRFSIERQGKGIRCLSTQISSASHVMVEALLGVPFILTLALQGIWCLHASAVAVNGKAVLFVGKSGAGKSTLAAELSDSKGVGERLTDDMMPIECTHGEALCLPSFPQLKLPADEQYGGDAESMGINCVFVLNPCATSSARAKAPRIVPLNQTDATLSLVRHSASSRLFSGDLLAEHLHACATLASGLQMYQVDYPLIPDSINRLRQWIQERQVV